jgi:hypothetical protein
LEQSVNEKRRDYYFSNRTRLGKEDPRRGRVPEEKTFEAWRLARFNGIYAARHILSNLLLSNNPAKPRTVASDGSPHEMMAATMRWACMGQLNACYRLFPVFRFGIRKAAFGGMLAGTNRRVSYPLRVAFDLISIARIV